ncbi:hypothetical protein A2631_00835 [Candidatus Daviesbacteria bacterium RIFCSPHIGHO2_01_FULL_44_29]|uniref:Uncharacterized protein n=1 Tax=Candidatus Daviesbacteria bacterium RIFCSPHIGHO2_02_FULL_43_12 TaxID=1797776 RepID=A0A1F5KHI3_9BACT|nr:MAG: hypothetical protein A2631_00835 [Candidatus Daviesbacteria bacterium RIFCSPHIGHO2_01_FULL_44_29]OGE39291.1 MAG: hypothetical protein A3E86_00595 [Candidatus Daviesbacteria bacterium RIFCSPHIGHO2_12_FULL_47_45]OGE40265.1 MAG: hypothetical protein A3D25_05300 [Candidatus Daviesbacteria bacterium RIFCSPHIGHO2_02_FULL_43_12]OGE69064.1 MAG: hypothetical protein A3B55_02380 [Candidatus Daviesbacteria bacterium RIFCSPLOWO2_01_FULL_43_15]
MEALNAFLSVSLLSWMALGLLVGYMVHILDYHSVNRSILGTLLTGVLGALAGGVFANIVLGSGVSGFNLWSLAIAAVGALSLAILQRSIFSNSGQEYQREAEVYHQQVTPLRNKDPKRITQEDDLGLNNLTWIQNLLQLAHYPISKADLIRSAEQMDSSSQVLSILENLPDHIYDNAQQIEKELDTVDNY